MGTVRTEQHLSVKLDIWDEENEVKKKGWRLGTGSETMSSRVRIERVGSQQ